MKQLRRERGLSQEEVALRADITTSYYGQLERGQANPSVSLLEKICSVMNIQIADIFTDTNTNILGIDAVSMQVLQQLSGKSEEEKALILSILKKVNRLSDISQKNE